MRVQPKVAISRMPEQGIFGPARLPAMRVTQSMNWRRHQNDDRQESRTEQRRREDEAARLTEMVPGITSLSIRVTESRPDVASSITPYIKHFVIASAPAMFEIRCSEQRCDGVHVLTDEIVDKLRRFQTGFKCEAPCTGLLGAGEHPCNRVLHCHVDATYTETNSY